MIRLTRVASPSSSSPSLEVPDRGASWPELINCSTKESSTLLHENGRSSYQQQSEVGRGGRYSRDDDGRFDRLSKDDEEDRDREELSGAIEVNRSHQGVTSIKPDNKNSRPSPS